MAAFLQITDFADTQQVEREPEVSEQNLPNFDYNRGSAQIAQRSYIVEFVPPQVGAFALPPALRALRMQFVTLLASEDIEVTPTAYAYLKAKPLVEFAYSTITTAPDFKVPPPRPTMGTNEVGGIMISWSSADKYVAASFGAQPGSRSFLYFEQGATHRAVELNEPNLLERLKWLSER